MNEKICEYKKIDDVLANKSSKFRNGKWGDYRATRKQVFHRMWIHEIESDFSVQNECAGGSNKSPSEFNKFLVLPKKAISGSDLCDGDPNSAMFQQSGACINRAN